MIVYFCILTSMGSTALNERVSVLAKFEAGKVLPVLMRWHGRRYWVQKLNLHHEKPEGGDRLHFYSVTTDAGECVLRYSRNDLSWTLEEVGFAGS